MKRIAFWALFLASCGSGAPAAPPAAAPVPVKVEVATPRSLDRIDEATGALEAEDSVELRPETSGIVASVSFKDGDVVKKGQVLVRLRDADAAAALLQAQSQAKLAGLDLDRAKALLERADIAPADLDRAEAQDGLARAGVQKAEEGLRRMSIRAPFDGTLGLREVSPGQTVDPSRSVGRIEALDTLVVDLSLPESALARVAVDQAAEVHVDALGDAALPAKVSFVGPRVRDDTRTVDVRVTLDAQDPRLRPGLSAQVHIVTSSSPSALLVPTQAVVPTAGGSSLWVMAADATVALKPVTLGERTADRVEVTSGLQAGDAVVVEGLARLRPGATVTVAAPPAPAEGAPAGAAAK